jgi:hypothetical protein
MTGVTPGGPRHSAEIIARQWVDAETAGAPLRERARLFAAFAAVHPITVGEWVADHSARPAFGRPLGEVRRVNATTVTVRWFYDGTEHRVPAQLAVRRYAEVLRAARSLVTNTAENHAGTDGAVLVVISCGGNKAQAPAPAGELYRGSYFGALLRAARALAPDERIRILSGRYGFTELATVHAPYDQRIDGPGAITSTALAAQVAADATLNAARRVMVLAGWAYAQRVREAFDRTGAEVEFPFAGARGIGDHLAWVKRLTAEAEATRR